MESERRVQPVNAGLGHAGLLVAFMAAVTGSVLGIGGLLLKRPSVTRQAATYSWVLLGGALLATFAMQKALINHDFSLDFVAHNNSVNTPLLFTISGMWSALEGSILLWGLILSVYIVTMVRHFRDRRDDAMVGWAMSVSLLVAVFFFGLMLGPADPFKSIAGGVVPFDGAGPNPLLQNHPLMAFHPPILYAGYVGFTIPFGFGIAALVTGRLGEGWLVETRRWALVAWAFLTTGIVLGAWWSYGVLGWGGYWAWDPVENASLLPWLTATAYLHSVMVQERRGMLRIWNISLLSATFGLTILGTFFTRSGILESVHAFSDSPLGPALLSAFAVVVVATCALIFWRGDRLGSPGSIGSIRSREAAFLANNMAFSGFAFVVLLGTSFPLIAEAVNGERISVGAPYFDGLIRPVGLTLLFLMAVAPVLPWRGTTNSVVNDRLLWPFALMVLTVIACVVLGIRGLWVLVAFGLAAFAAGSALRQLVLSVRRTGARGLVGSSNGGMVAHIGVAIVAVALAASQSFVGRSELQIKPGETVMASGHSFTLVGLREESHPNRRMQVADIVVDQQGPSGPSERDKRQTYSPSLSSFPNSTDAIGTPAVRVGLFGDVYLTLVRTPSSPGESAVVSVIVQPLVTWLWIGGFIIAIGAVLALVPSGRRQVEQETKAPEGEPEQADTELVPS